MTTQSFKNSGCFSQSVSYLADKRYVGAEWWIRTWGSYGFSQLDIIGEFKETPKPWPKSSRQKLTYDSKSTTYEGLFNHFGIVGNNDCRFGSAILSLSAVLDKIWVSPKGGYYSNLPITVNPYPIHFVNPLPNNRLRGFFYCVDVYLPGGWVRIEYPWISEVHFSGWPILPANSWDRSFPSGWSLDACTDKLSLVSQCLNPDDPEKASKPRTLPSYPSSAIPPLVDPEPEISLTVNQVSEPELEMSEKTKDKPGPEPEGASQLPPPEPVLNPRVLASKVKNSVGRTDIPFKIPADFENAFVDCSPVAMKKLYENLNWKSLLFEGCFHELSLFDTTAASKAYIKAPFTRLRLWITEEFPCHREDS